MTCSELCKAISKSTLSESEVRQVVKAMTEKNYISGAVFVKTPQAETFGHFLKRFWNFDKSPYIQQKVAKGHMIHRRYALNMYNRCLNYWIPGYGRKPVGTITKEDIEKVMLKLSKERVVVTKRKDKAGRPVCIDMQLKSETVNQIIRAATFPLKWAFEHGLTQQDCFSGLTYCHIQRSERHIVTLSQAKKLFTHRWEDRIAETANALAMYTGMRIGEIQALQIRDIGPERIQVRHNWAHLDGLKEPKNGESRIVPINDKIYRDLCRIIKDNPYGASPDDFVFWGKKKELPVNSKVLNRALRQQLEANGIDDKKITFHSWRHFYSSYMADQIDERKLKLATGHKSLDMLHIYSTHESEQALRDLSRTASKVFAGIYD